VTIKRFASFVVTVVVAAGCIDLSAPGSGVLSLSPFRLPYPSVVVGDTLRDSTGAAVPLRIVALDARGDTVADPEVSFLVSAPSEISVSPAGFLTGLQLTESPARIVAQVEGLQVEARIDVVPRPTDAVRASPDEIPAVSYVPGSGQTALLRSADLSVRVESVTGSTATPVRSWLVSYEITRMPAGVPGGVPPAYLGSETDSESRVDTTGSNGVAMRRVVIRQALLTGLAADTVEVRATVRERGTQLQGSPITFVVPIRAQ
jgi:hypothetical protein